MVTVIGHDSVRKLLEDNLPQVVSFMGPDSIGKRTLALHIRQYYKIHSVDFGEFFPPFSAESARQLQEWARYAPFGDKKLAVLHLDKASESALNDILKLLEEPPSYMYFILIISEQTLLTIMSRSQVYRLGKLSPDELERVLVRFEGMPEAAAKKVSFSGQVFAAKKAHQGVNSRNAALAVLKSVEAQDLVMLRRAFKAVDDYAVTLIETGLFEAASGLWQHFKPEELPFLAKRPTVALRLFEALGTTGSARRSLSARVVLESSIRRN